jgi:hypothetical protein
MSAAAAAASTATVTGCDDTHSTSSSVAELLAKLLHYNTDTF